MHFFTRSEKSGQLYSLFMDSMQYVNRFPWKSHMVRKSLRRHTHPEGPVCDPAGMSNPVFTMKSSILFTRSASNFPPLRGFPLDRQAEKSELYQFFHNLLLKTNKTADKIGTIIE